MPKPSLQAKLSNCFDKCCMGNEHIVWDGEMNDAENSDRLKLHLISSWLQLFIYLEGRDQYPKYKDKVTFRKVQEC